MRISINKGVFALLLTALPACSGFSSPLSSKLLPLVPPGAEVVCGFENYREVNAHGRLLLTTHNSRVDLDDWQALSGVDTKRVFHEVIEVAASLSGAELKEHLLLVWGAFDRERIFAAAEQNGAERMEYQGQSILIIKPFPREKGDMVDTRWLVILDNRIGLLGTPELMRQALRRYATHALPDPILQERLSQLRSDVTSWNVLVSEKAASNINFSKPHSAWASLQEDTDVLLVGTRFGTHIRVDFALDAGAAREPAFFHRKAAFFTAAFAQEGSPSPDSLRTLERRLQNFSVEPNRVQGSIELSEKQFGDWCVETSRVVIAHPQAAVNGN